jgi:hypothetical protein
MDRRNVDNDSKRSSMNGSPKYNRGQMQDFYRKNSLGNTSNYRGEEGYIRDSNQSLTR